MRPSFPSENLHMRLKWKMLIEIGACPTTHVSEISIENGTCKEETTLSRTVGSKEYIQHAHECEMKKITKIQ